MTDDLPTRLGRFEVQALLGEGGMGRVLRCYDPQLARAVAIKILDEGIGPERLEAVDGETIDLRKGSSPATTDRLFAEARALAQINDPNVLAVHEIGTDRGRTFLVMELVEGVDLAIWLARDPRPELPMILDAFAQAGRGLAAAHRSGVVHRDIKPSNLLVGNDGRVRVADFGISLQAQRTLVRIAERASGTPRYMAPELCRGEPATVHSDLYAFAVALVEAVVGEPPGPGSTEAVRVALEVRGANATLATEVVRCLAEAPRDRPESVEPIVALLADREDRPERPGSPAPRRRVIIAVSIAGLTLGVAGVAAWTGTSGSPPECEAAGARLAGRWDAVRRAEVGKSIAPYGEAVVKSVIGALDHYADAWTELHAKTCSEPTAGATRAARLACLDRRLYELGAVARVFLAPIAKEQTLVRATTLPDLRMCVAMAHLDLPVDRATHPEVEAITAELIAIQDRAIAKHRLAEEVLHLEPLVGRAEAIGDHALAIRIDRVRAQLTGNLGKLLEAAKLYDGAYERAVKHHLELDAGQVLVDAANIAKQRGDFGGAESDLRIARGLIENSPEATPSHRFRVYRAIGEMRLQRADYAGARESYELAQRAADATSPPDHLYLGELYRDRANLEDSVGRYADAVALATKSEAEFARLGPSADGKRAKVMRVRAEAEAHRGDREAAWQIDRDRAALLGASPNWKLEKIDADADVATDLLAAGHYADAIAGFDKALARSEETKVDAALRHWWIASKAIATARLGDVPHAIELAQRAADNAREQFGDGDMRVGIHLREIAELELEQGQLDHAHAHLNAAKDRFAAIAADDLERLLVAQVEIDLDLFSHDLAGAKALAERSLALLTERNAPEIRREPFWIGAARAARLAGDPKTALEHAQRALASRARPPDRGAATRAVAELEVAAAKYALGDHDAAVAARAAEAALRSPETVLDHALALAWMRDVRLAPSR